MTNTNTLRSVLYSRFLRWIDRSSLRKIRKSAVKATLFLALAVALIAPSFALGLLVNALEWDGFRIPITCALFLVAYSLHRLSKVRPSADTIEGIPTTELIDHLVTAGTFKGGEVERKFHASRHRVTALAKRLKEIEVLVPGRNNLATLNPAFSRQDIASILAGAATAREVTPLMRRTDFGLTSEPSAAEIQERVAPLLQAPGFAFRTLAYPSGGAMAEPVGSHSGAECGTASMVGSAA